MKQQIKAIIFDIGGVIVNESDPKIYKILSKRFNLDLNKFKRLRKRHYKNVFINRNPFEYEMLLAKDLNIIHKPFIFHWQKLINKHLILKKDSKIILKNLKKNYILGTLTNVSHSYDVIRIKNKVYSDFEFNLKSCDLKLKKPDIKIFKHLLKELNKKKIKPQEAIFVDDLKRNLIPAKKMKLNTILFKNNRQLIKDLRKFGVKI